MGGVSGMNVHFRSQTVGTAEIASAKWVRQNPSFRPRWASMTELCD